MEKLLAKLYFDPSSSVCYAGVSALLREARKRDKGVTRTDVENFLAKQRTYSLHKPVRKKFRRNRVIAVGVDTNWQADLADFQKLAWYNKNYKYVLTCVDVFSKYVWAVPVKNKKPETVARAFESILDDGSGRRPWSLYTDRGKEFVGRPFQKMLEERGVRHVLATSPDVKAPNVERFNRTLKSRLWKYFTRNKTLNYLDVLPAMTRAINRSYSRPIGCAPVEVTMENENVIRKRLYGSIVPSDKFTFKVGDYVRIAKEKNVFEKAYKAGYTEEVFVVCKRLKRDPVVYKLKDLNGEAIEGVFYKEELSRATTPDEEDKDSERRRKRRRK
jgi:hypothetical protein